MKVTAISSFLVLVFAGVVTGTDSPGPAAEPVRAFRLTEPINMDGKLSETVWKNENAATGFVQRDPVEGAVPSEKTMVDILFDDEAIYIGARMYDSAPGSIVARLARKDVQVTADTFTFFVDPYHDKRTGYYFSINAAGTLYDGTLLNDSWDDDAWDGVWEGKARIDDQGWSAEMRIPYSQLKFEKADAWGVNFKRQIARKNENVYLVYTPKNGSGFVSRFVELQGIENISPPRRLEIVPYVTSKASFLSHGIGDPFNDGSLYDPGIGADMKVGLGTNLTLNATVNPDFGQVEVDPAVVNLGDVETFFQEKRPFFIEGSSIFDFGKGGANNYWGFNWSDPLFFYSRRIGRPPQGSAPDADFVDIPDGTSILGAAKLTGKLFGSLNIGALNAFTGRESASLSTSGVESTAEIEPFTYYGVYRGQNEFHEGKQGIGFMTTLATRSFDDVRLKDEINSSSIATGIDGWTYLDANQSWVVAAWTGLSYIEGTTARITDVQQNSQHYFQRPDADYVELDPNATSLTGTAGRIQINKQKGNSFVNSAFGWISPAFDINDVGFLWRADAINFHIGGGYKWTEPGKFFRFREIGGATFRNMDFGGDTTWSGVFVYNYMELANYWIIDSSFAVNPETTINNTRTRGGPETLNLPGWEANLSVTTDNRKNWVYGFGGNSYESEIEHFRSVNATVEWKPGSNVSVSVNPRIESEKLPAQYVGTFVDPLATNTFGSRYVFGFLDQKTFVASLRLNWTFKPNLSLQLYAQPLISSGDYTEFKELAASRTFDFNIYDSAFISLNGGEYTIDPDGTGAAAPIVFSDPNFNFKSLRGNAILRWEYRPGSTVYFVWTQARSEEENIGDFQLGHSFSRLWDAKADNIFLVKFSYYWNL